MGFDVKYGLHIVWSAEDRAFVVEVPELPGCMADGKTYQEAVANTEIICNGHRRVEHPFSPQSSLRTRRKSFKTLRSLCALRYRFLFNLSLTNTNTEIIIQEWLETAREVGMPVPEPRGRLAYA